ncbi:uncharacterized protein [Ranitomeya imitator]|uniref:uncharacterized protein isoform X2 n=1 Tax=Ranitomeya imitator TaxID=111125 RepID=UPI0037E777C0
MVTSLKSYTRDSTHLLQLLEECEMPENTLPISMDVESLYTSIAHHSATSIDFLDLRLSIMDSRIERHPEGSIERNCSTDQEFRHQARDLSARFKKRGYPQRLISRAFQHACQQDRKNLFEKKSPSEYSRENFSTADPGMWCMLSSVTVQRCTWNRPRRS